ncbi:MAG: rRNA maturation RNase YbeY [Armatimonadota bacterium]|nr:rRNA maturation RNase YbeY [Armatimonadota bacterium]
MKGRGLQTQILIRNEQQRKVNTQRLRRTARRLLSAENCPEEAEVSILLVDDDTIHELNRQYRGVDAPTDVLAFSQLEGEDFGSEGELVLGDVVISVDTAARQAEEQGHSLEEELDLLLAHGLLHLLGYDHETPEDERRMFDRQRELVGK